MQKLAFADLPTITKLASFATLFIGWVLFEELVIDRHGLDRFLPFYRVGNLCPYDLAMLGSLGLAWIWLHERRRR